MIFCLKLHEVHDRNYLLFGRCIQHIQVLYTSQRWHFVDKNFRSLSFGCYECNTILGNLTVTRHYDPVDYDNLCSNSDYDKRRKIHPKLTESFLQTEDIRNCYDSYRMLESAKAKQYMDRAEIILNGLSGFCGSISWLSSSKSVVCISLAGFKNT